MRALPKKTTRSLRQSSAGIALALVFAAACRVAPPEQVLLRQFFEQSRVRDRTTLANIATVIFEPTRDGVVQAFEISDIETSGSTKRVAVDAQVRSLDGTTMRRPLMVTMERFNGRWMITRIR